MIFTILQTFFLNYGFIFHHRNDDKRQHECGSISENIQITDSIFRYSFSLELLLLYIGGIFFIFSLYME